MSKTAARILAASLFVVLSALGGLSLRKRTDCFSCPVCGSCKTDTQYSIYGMPIFTGSSEWGAAKSESMHETIGDSKHIYDRSMFLIENPLSRKEIDAGECLSAHNISPAEDFVTRFCVSIVLNHTDSSLPLETRRELYASLYSTILDMVNEKTRFEDVHKLWAQASTQGKASVPEFLAQLRTKRDAEQ